MKNLVKLSTVALVSTGISVSAMAEVAQPQANVAVTEETQLTTTDLSYAFADGQSVDTVSMNSTEMQDTEGAVAWVPIIVGGAALLWANKAY